MLFAFPTFTSRRLSGAISFTSQARRAPCIARLCPAYSERQNAMQEARVIKSVMPGRCIVRRKLDVCYQISDRARSLMRCRVVMSLLAGLGRGRFALLRFAFRNFRSSASKKVSLTRMRAGASRITRSHLSTLTRSMGRRTYAVTGPSET